MSLRKPSEHEEGYFKRLGFEGLTTPAEEGGEELREAKRQEPEEVHVLCPGCGMELVDIEYRGVEIDKLTVRWRLDQRQGSQSGPLHS